MARQTARTTIRRTVTRVKKDGSANNAGYMSCNICHGTGIVKKSNHRKKK